MGRKAKDVSPLCRLHCSFLQQRNNSLLWAAKMLEEEGTRGVFLFVRGEFAFQAPGFLCAERLMSDEVDSFPYASSKGGGKSRACLGLDMF